jgi:radical SAM superfamily enzyme YgiQ (UPF0313 family)
VVLGGPEVSHETAGQQIVRDADYVVTGWGDITFPKLCREIVRGPKPLMKIHAGEQPPMGEIRLPYDLYSDEDIAHRTLYVEASRGCPFKCEFCLSALDKTAWPFPLDGFLVQIETLYQRGARLFKFVDRTFNLNVKTSQRILEFFLDKLQANPGDPVYAHFELVPDHLPDGSRPEPCNSKSASRASTRKCKRWSAAARITKKPPITSAGCTSIRTPTCTST